MSESIVADKFKGKSYTDISDSDKNQYSEPTYESAQKKYGKTVNGRTMYMPKEEWEANKKSFENNTKNAYGAIADEIEAKQNKTVSKPTGSSSFNDVKAWAEKNKKDGQSTGSYIADWLRENKDYEVGPKTVQGMKELGYVSDDKGNFTAEDVLETVNKISDSVPQAQNVINQTLGMDGKPNEKKASDAVTRYEQKLVEMGAGKYDKDGNFVLTPTDRKKDWETWATLLSVGLSALGIAMGVPIIPINFRTITGKDANREQIQALQNQYMNIKSGAAGNVEAVKSDIDVGNVALKNKEALEAQEKHSQATAAQKDILKTQKENEKDLIETRTNAEIRRDENTFKNDMKRLQADNNFRLLFADLEQKYKKEFAELQDSLSTGSAIDILKFQNSGFIKDLKDSGISPSDFATYLAAKQGISPADKNWNRVKTVTGAIGDVAGSVGDIVNPFK
jgi:hypothetical protein